MTRVLAAAVLTAITLTACQPAARHAPPAPTCKHDGGC
jgi:hypothetical protein